MFVEARNSEYKYNKGKKNILNSAINFCVNFPGKGGIYLKGLCYTVIQDIQFLLKTSIIWYMVNCNTNFDCHCHLSPF